MITNFSTKETLSKEEITEYLEDNLLSGFRLLKGTEGVDWKQTDTYEYFSTGCSIPWLNTFLYSKEDKSNLEKFVSDVIKYFEQKKLNGVWRISQFSTEQEKLNEILTSLGYEKSTAPVMTLDLKTFNLGENLDNLQIIPLTAERVSEWMIPFAACFGLNPSDANFFEKYWKKVVRDENDFDSYLGIVNNEVVSCASISLNGKIPAIYNIGTLLSHQRQGFGSQMTKHCIQKAQERGYSQVGLFSSSAGIRTYQKLGFVEIATVTNYLIMPTNKE